MRTQASPLPAVLVAGGMLVAAVAGCGPESAAFERNGGSGGRGGSGGMAGGGGGGTGGGGGGTGGGGTAGSAGDDGGPIADGSDASDMAAVDTSLDTSHDCDLMVGSDGGMERCGAGCARICVPRTASGNGTIFTITVATPNTY